MRWSAIVGSVCTPTFVYDESVLVSNCSRIIDIARAVGLHNRLKLCAAYFTNSQPHLFRILTMHGIGIVLQTYEELVQVRKFGLDAPLTVSPSYLSDIEIEEWIGSGIERLNLAGLQDVEYFVSRNSDVRPSVRLDLSEGSNQRTGIKPSQYVELNRICPKGIDRLHVYIGTGSDISAFVEALDKVFSVMRDHFPTARTINLGGGFAYDYDTGEHFPWEVYLTNLVTKAKEHNVPAQTRFVVEPGRDLFADCGTLITKIKRIVHTDNAIQVATDASYTLMPSATVRERQHRITFLDGDFHELQPGDEKGRLSGCSTMSRDYLLPGEIILPAQLTDARYVVVHDVGAYCASQHMRFLNVRPPAEVLIDRAGRLRLIATRGPYDDGSRLIPREPGELK